METIGKQMSASNQVDIGVRQTIGRIWQGRRNGGSFTFNHGVAGSSPAGLATVVSGTLILDGAVTAIGGIISPYSNPLCRLLQATMRRPCMTTM
jgi:hypothetical protein